MGKGLGKEVVVGKRTVDGKKEEIVVTYVPRTVLVESDGGYESVRLEERLERALEEHGLSLLFGLSGVGKSTSAEYVSKVFAERGWVVIKLIPIGEGRKEDKKRDFRIDVVRYGDKAVFHVYISTSYLGSKDRMMKLAYAISKLSKKVVEDEKRDFKIDVVRYGDKAVFHVYISTSYLGSEERMMKLAYAISKLSKKVVKD